MKRVMLTSYNKILDETKVTGPYPANGLQRWLDRQAAESALGYITWKTRDLTPEEDLKPTESYILQGND